MKVFSPHYTRRLTIAAMHTSCTSLCSVRSTLKSAATLTVTADIDLVRLQDISNDYIILLVFSILNCRNSTTT